MAVYTPVSQDALITFLQDYHLGALQSYKGIEQGVSNTNYHLYTDAGHYILTLFEPHRVHEEDISFFLDYSDCMAADGIPCPAVMTTHDGRKVMPLHNRPATIFAFLEGDDGNPAMITPAIMGQVGAMSARMHNAAAAAIREQQPNHFSLPRWSSWLERMGQDMDRVSPGLYAFCRDEYELIERIWPADLPRGAIHGDLFPDNVFFKDGGVSGVIDFHFVCTDFFAYDLAIIVNAWCFDAQNVFQQDRYDALMKAYNEVRSLSAAETEAFPLFLRAASMRFLLSRAEEFLNHKPDNLMKPHDPLVFLTRLKHFQNYG
jgi:homoserine kinase type II